MYYGSQVASDACRSARREQTLLSTLADFRTSAARPSCQGIPEVFLPLKGALIGCSCTLYTYNVSPAVPAFDMHHDSQEQFMTTPFT